MSFSSQVKDELKGRIDNAKHCQIAELAAYMAFCGTVGIVNGRMVAGLYTENETVAVKFEQLMHKAFGILPEELNVYNAGKNTIIVEIKDEEIVELLLLAIKWKDIGSDSINMQFVNPLIVKKDCCRKAFIRGAFIATGSISDPNKFYHYELVCNEQNDAQCLKDMLNHYNLDAKVIERKKHYVVYIKEGELITDCLNVMGAVVSQMELYNVMILKGISNDINRKVNCETANLNKTISAALKQIKDIEYIRDTVGLGYLKPSLEEVACVRLENTDSSLSDIGKMLEPPVGKSGVNHRLKKISEIAAGLRGDASGNGSNSL